MRELVGPDGVAAGVDRGDRRTEVLVDLDHAAFPHGDTHVLEAQARRVRPPADGDEHGVERHPHLVPALGRADQQVATVGGLDAHGAMLRQEVDALRGELARKHVHDIRVLAHQQVRGLLHHRDGRAEAAERLREFTPDRTAAQHDEA